MNPARIVTPFLTVGLGLLDPALADTRMSNRDTMNSLQAVFFYP